MGESKDISKRRRRARPGDVVTVDWHLVPENGFVPDSLFDSKGKITFVVGGGNYLPGLHSLVEGMRIEESVSGVSVDAGWGERREDLVVRVHKHKLKSSLLDDGCRCNVDKLSIGQTLRLKGGIDVLVMDIRRDSSVVVLDGNPPLAGSSYACNLTVLDVQPFPNHKLEYHDDKDAGVCKEEATGDSSCCGLEVATFALGCFWGAELAFQRLPGVVDTMVGYSQGVTESPTYDQVLTGQTKHRETTRVVYKSEQVSYEQLCHTAMERLKDTTSPMDLHRFFQEKEEDEDQELQYRHGFYYHTEEQREIAEKVIASKESNDRYCIEILKAKTFYPAEDYHQQYLYKGGQSTRKGAKEAIRCYG